MTQITSFRGETKEISCLSCAIIEAKVKNPGPIVRTEYFDVHQDYEIPIPGMAIITSVRHIKSVDEFTQKEQLDFIATLSRVRIAQRQELGIIFVYLIQEEDTNAHFHMWVFPRYDWMKEKFGTKIQSVHPIIEYARANMKTKEKLKEVDDAIRKLRNSF